MVSLEKYGEHIFPVYEDPNAVRWTVAKYSDDHNKPVFWAVDAKSYGHKRGESVQERPFYEISTYC